MTNFNFYFYKYFRWLRHVPFYIPFYGFIFIDFDLMKNDYELALFMKEIKSTHGEIINDLAFLKKILK